VRRERIAREFARFQFTEPPFNHPPHFREVQIFMIRSVWSQIGLSQSEQRSRWSQAILLQVNERASELDESFVKRVIWPPALREPEFFQDVVRFEEQALIETFEVPQVMCIQGLPAKLLDHARDFVAFVAHALQCSQSRKIAN
jgi:hypothetical protein